MKNLSIVLFLALIMSCTKPQTGEVMYYAPSTPTPNKIVEVIFENKLGSEIRGNDSAPYFNSLILQGTVFINSQGVTHPSQPNYLAIFSGSTQGSTNDDCLTPHGFTTTNLYNELNKVSKTFKWFSEGLPSAGSTTCSSGSYVRKHNPTPLFKNYPDSRNLPLSALNWSDSSQFKSLSSVNFITPNLNNDMHNGSIGRGDRWLRATIDSYVQWSKINNSILIVTFDESDSKGNNNIITIFVGQHVLSSTVVSTTYSHYAFTKTICSLFHASTTWTSSISNAPVITSWEK